MADALVTMALRLIQSRGVTAYLQQKVVGTPNDPKKPFLGRTTTVHNIGVTLVAVREVEVESATTATKTRMTEFYMAPPEVEVPAAGDLIFHDFPSDRGAKRPLRVERAVPLRVGSEVACYVVLAVA